MTVETRRVILSQKCVCEWHPKTETGNGSRLFCWDPRPSYLSCYWLRSDPSSCSLRRCVCGCCNLSKSNRLSRWSPSGPGEGRFRSELSATRMGYRLWRVDYTPKTAIRNTSWLLVERDPLFTLQAHATSSLGSGLNTQTVTEYDIITVEVLPINY